MFKDTPRLKRELKIGEEVKFGCLQLEGERAGVVYAHSRMHHQEVIVDVTFLPEDNQKENPHIVHSCLVLEREPLPGETQPASHWQYCYPISV